jgi:hypothetical protein
MLAERMIGNAGPNMSAMPNRNPPDGTVMAAPKRRASRGG